MRFLSASKLMVAAVIVTGASACGGDGPTPPSAASLDITPSDIRLTRIGETAQITATPKDASGNTVTADINWSSDNTAIATVEDQGNVGLVTARGFGTAKITASAGGSAVKTVNVIVGELRLNVNSNENCTNADMRTARVEHTSQRLIIMADVANPAGGFTAADYAQIGAVFDTLVWPVLVQNFGEPSDVDNNGKVIAFYTKAVNELTPENNSAYVGGFFFGRDLFPKTSCAGSNVAEMFYMLVPDPDGAVNNNKRSLDFVKSVTVGVIGHEMQHLLNASRRIYVNKTAPPYEVPFMEEGLSHIAEELLFYSAAGLTPKMNIHIDTLRASQAPERLEAVNLYQLSNMRRFRSYLENPTGNSPYANNDNIGTRGATWAWLRYLADRAGVPTTPSPACTQTVALAAGATCQIEGAATAQFDVVAGGAAGEYTIVAFASGAALSTTASATSAVAVTGPPNPTVASYGSQGDFGGGAPGSFASRTLTLNHQFHIRLRERQQRELRHQLPYARAEYAARARQRPAMSRASASVSFATAPFVEPVWSRLANSPDTGFKNLQNVFGQDLWTPARDWAVAHYTDDAVSGVPGQYTHPSWHFRNLIAHPAITPSETYPLKTHSLTSAVPLEMVDGGAAYYRLGVAQGGTSTVRFTVGGGPPPASLRLVVVRTK